MTVAPRSYKVDAASFTGLFFSMAAFVNGDDFLPADMPKRPFSKVNYRERPSAKRRLV